jgi:hypothetical protein
MNKWFGGLLLMLMLMLVFLQDLVLHIYFSKCISILVPNILRGSQYELDIDPVLWILM